MSHRDTLWPPQPLFKMPRASWLVLVVSLACRVGEIVRGKRA